MNSKTQILVDVIIFHNKNMEFNSESKNINIGNAH